MNNTKSRRDHTFQRQDNGSIHAAKVRVSKRFLSFQSRKEIFPAKRMVSGGKKNGKTKTRKTVPTRSM